MVLKSKKKRYKGFLNKLNRIIKLYMKIYNSVLQKKTQTKVKSIDQLGASRFI